MSCLETNPIGIPGLPDHLKPCSPCEPDYLIRDYCFVACTDIKLNFKYPTSVPAALIKDLWITIVDSDESDMQLVKGGDWSNSPDIIDLEKAVINITQCDLCIDGGIYYYQLMAQLTNGDAKMVGWPNVDCS